MLHTRKLTEQINGYSENITVLRFIAALCVIISHSYHCVLNGYDLVNSYTDSQCTLGGIAVSVFFFLSGFYVTKSLEKNKSLRLFLWKRCKRVFPQLWIVVLGTVFVLGPVITTVDLKTYFSAPLTYRYLFYMLLIPEHNLPGTFLYNPDRTVNGPLWTMPVEFACYVALTLIMAVTIVAQKKLFKKFRRVILDVLSLILIVAVYIYILYGMRDDFLITAVRPVVFFFAGVVIYDLREKIFLNPLVGFILLLILIALGRTPFFNIALVVILPYCILSICLGLPDMKIRPRVFKASYEMYLIGWPIQQVLMNSLQMSSPAENWLMAIPIDICLGYLLYAFTEMLNSRSSRRKSL